MSIRGLCVNVRDVVTCDFLSADVLVGATILPVYSTSIYNENGGQVTVDDGTHTETVTYSIVDTANDQLALPIGLANAYAADTPVIISPVQTTRYADVQSPDLSDDTISVRVPFQFVSQLSLGTRGDATGDSVPESVICDVLAGEWVLVDILGASPLVSGDFIDPGFVPPPPPSTDGSPPASSPAAIVTGGIGYLAVRWSTIANADRVTYEVYVSTTNGFTPDITTFVGEIDGSLLFVHNLADGSPLVLDTTYYVVIIAKDGDGRAAPGSQGSGVLIRLPSDDQTTDGLPPSFSPTPTVTGGFHILSVKWNPVTNVDPVTYDVHISTSNGFTPTTGTRVGSTMATSFVIMKDGAGVALVFGTTYYVKLVASDGDGSAAAGTQASAQLVAVDGGSDIIAGTIIADDIAAGTITANEIAADTITADQIAAAAITVSELAADSVTTDKIVAGAVTADQLLAEAVTADKLAAVLTLSTKIVAGASETAARAEIDSSGIHIYAPDDPDTGELNLLAELTGQGLVVGGMYVGNLDSPSVLTRQTEDLILYVNADLGDDADDGLNPGQVIDNFNRTTSSAWGTASDGDHAWNKAAGTAANFSTDGTYGIIAQPASTALHVMQASLWGEINQDLVFKVRANQVAPGAVAHLHAAMHMVADDTYYKVGFTIPNGGGVVTSDIRKLVAGVETSLDSAATSYTFAANTDYLVRARATHVAESDSTRLTVKFWLATDPEPDPWDVDFTDTNTVLATQGTIGIASRMGGAGAPAETWKIDNLTASHLAIDPDADTETWVIDTSGAPLATVQQALAKVRNFVESDVRIVTAAQSDQYEALIIQGFFGEGEMIVDFGAGVYTNLFGSLIIDGVALDFTYVGGAIEDDGSGNDNATVSVSNSGLVAVDQVQVNSNGLKPSNVRFSASRGDLSNSKLNGATARNMAADSESMVRADSNTGDAIGGGDGYRANASVIFVTGTQPNNSNSAANSGQIFTTPNAADGTLTGGAAGGSTKTTKYYKAKKTTAYHTTFGWDDPSNDSLFQSLVYKGLWTYDYASIQADLSGKTIDSIQIFVKRTSDVGDGGALHLKFYDHMQTSSSIGSGGNPTFSNAHEVGTVKWGEGKWITISNTFASRLRDNNARGIGVFNDDYLALFGVMEVADSGKLKITYHA